MAAQAGIVPLGARVHKREENATYVAYNLSF